VHGFLKFDSQLTTKTRNTLKRKKLKSLIKGLKHFPIACFCCCIIHRLVIHHLQYITTWIEALCVATLPWESVRMKLTLPKLGLGSPQGFPKLQSSIVGVKTPRIGVFFISLESYWILDVENGLAWAIWTSAAQVMAKRKARGQIGSLTPDH